MDNRVWPPPSRVSWPNWVFREGQEVRIGEDLYKIQRIDHDGHGNKQVTFELIQRRIHAHD